MASSNPDKGAVMQRMALLKFVFPILTALAAGCVTPVYNYSPVTSTSATQTGDVRTVNVGDVIVARRVETQQQYLSVHQLTEVGWGNSYTINEGLYRMLGQDGESAFFAPENDFEGGGKLDKGALSDPRKAVQAYKDRVKICAVSVFNDASCTSKTKYEFVTKTVHGASSAERALIYNGKTGTVVRIGYRESSGSAPPVTTNVVTYDLLESTIINYQGARIEFLGATGESIEFKVLQGFAEAE